MNWQPQICAQITLGSRERSHRLHQLCTALHPRQQQWENAGSDRSVWAQREDKAERTERRITELQRWGWAFSLPSSPVVYDPEEVGISHTVSPGAGKGRVWLAEEAPAQLGCFGLVNALRAAVVGCVLLRSHTHLKISPDRLERFLCVTVKQEPWCFHEPSSNLTCSRTEVRAGARALQFQFWDQHQSIPTAATRWQPDEGLSAAAAEAVNSAVNL